MIPRRLPAFGKGWSAIIRKSMENHEPRPIHDAFAADYDRQALEYHCFIPEILFGMCYEYLAPGEWVLDIGIGTGLSAAPFSKAGLDVSGIDVSQKMLEICREKGFASDLRQFDISNRPWPYPDAAFDHAICCGVIHFFDDLEGVFLEVARIVRPRGTFSFTSKVPPPGRGGVYREVIGGIPVYSHDIKILDQLGVHHGFQTLKMARVLVGDERDQSDGLFRAFVTRRKP